MKLLPNLNFNVPLTQFTFTLTLQIDSKPANTVLKNMMKKMYFKTYYNTSSVLPHRSSKIMQHQRRVLLTKSLTTSSYTFFGSIVLTTEIISQEIISDQRDLVSDVISVYSCLE